MTRVTVALMLAIGAVMIDGLLAMAGVQLPLLLEALFGWVPAHAAGVFAASMPYNGKGSSLPRMARRAA